jgi:hypothetical protein
MLELLVAWRCLVRSVMGTRLDATGSSNSDIIGSSPPSDTFSKKWHFSCRNSRIRPGLGILRQWALFQRRIVRDHR